MEQKLNPPPKKKNKKKTMPILWPLRVPERGNAKTQRNTLEIDEQVMTDLHRLPLWLSLSRHKIVTLKSYFGSDECVFLGIYPFCRRLLEVFQKLFSAEAD